MPSPSLIVGLGGTGTLVATYIKKDLMELKGGKWPLEGVRILSFDTDKKQPAIGGQGEIRQAGKSTGAVQLAEGEFSFIGGNVERLIREVDAGKHPHLRSWVLSEFYLRDAKIAPAQYNLNNGAGQFRQFGRLAVFRDVASPAESKLFNSIKSAFGDIKRDFPNTKGIRVFLVSSLAGGTGAGMFVDVAYLIRKIAGMNDIDLHEKMILRGYLVLPDAFRNTLPDPSVLPAMYARSFAGMRENSRFTVSFDYSRGYPMHYNSAGNDEIWHDSLKTKLFDLLYYIDGSGDRNPLGGVELKHGIAPMIADAISAAIDSEAGDAFESHVSNIDAQRAERITAGLISGKTSTFGSVGTYTIVLPIYSIMEAWTHDLGIEALKALVTPEDYSSDDDYPAKLKTNANAEKVGVDGYMAARDFLKATEPVTYQFLEKGVESKKVEAEPTLLLRELGRIAEKASRSDARSILDELTIRSIADWKPHFIPNSQDINTVMLLRKVESILNNRLYDRQGLLGQVLSSDQIKQKKINFSTEAERITEDARVFIINHLGDEDKNTGQRAGGRYRQILKEINTYHINRFITCLNYYIQSVLNGGINILALVAKGGKLGFLFDFLDNLFTMLNITKQTMEKVRTARMNKGSSRVEAIAAMKTLELELKTSAAKRGFGASDGAQKAQHTYLDAVSRLIDILEAEAVEESILAAVDDMLDYVRKSRETINSWQQTLALSNQGLFANLSQGRNQVISDRATDKDIICRMIINDPEYEKKRYDEYVKKDNALDQILGSLNWKMQTKLEDKQEKLVGLQLLIEQNGNTKALTPQPSDENLLDWLKLCRQPFAGALRDESVIRYLMENKEFMKPASLADAIYNYSGVALKFDGSGSLKANFLRAYFQTDKDSKHREYLESLIQTLAQKSSIATLKGESSATGESKFGNYVNSEDRFKFSLIFTQELIQLENIEAYSKSGLKEYMGGEGKVSSGDRRVRHIFPAEVHAIPYESRLPELKQKIRLFTDDVVLQLEDLEQFRLFLMCYVYGLILRTGVKTGTSETAKQVWVLRLPPENETDAYGNPMAPDETYLTDPERPASIHDALMTFNFIGLDVGHGGEYAKAIDYEAVSNALKRRRQENARQRVEAGKAGEGDPLKQMVENIADEVTRKDNLFELAFVDRIKEAYNNLMNNELPKTSRNLGNPETQKEYDIQSVFALMLGDELMSVRKNVQDTISGMQTF